MRKFLFDVILGIFIGIGACIAGIIALFDILDLDNFKEIRDNIVADIKDFIHELLYGYHHNRSFNAEWQSSINSRSCDTTKTYSSIYGRWNSTSKSDTDTKEDDKEEASSGH